MNRAAVRELLADTWFRVLLAALPLAFAAQFVGSRPVSETVVSVVFLAACSFWSIATLYRRTVQRIADRAAARAEADTHRELAAFLAEKRK